MYKIKGLYLKYYKAYLRLYGVLITTVSVLRAMFHAGLSGTDWTLSYCGLLERHFDETGLIQ